MKPERPQLSDKHDAPKLPKHDQSLDDLVSDLRDSVPGMELFVHERQDVVVIDQIIIPEHARGQGLGVAIIQKICDYSDKNELSAAVTPDSTFGTSKTKLIKFYRQFGFVPNKGSNKDMRSMESMIRKPTITRDRQQQI